MKETIGKKIAEAREQRGLTQKDLADFLELKSPQAVSEIERGKVNIAAADLYKLADYLTKPIAYFYGDYFDSPEREDAIALVKQLSQEELKGLVNLARANTRMKGLAASLPQEGLLNPADHIDMLQKFYSEILDIKKPIEAQLMTMNQVIAQFEELIGLAKLGD